MKQQSLEMKTPETEAVSQKRGTPSTIYEREVVLRPVQYAMFIITCIRPYKSSPSQLHLHVKSRKERL